MCAIWSGFGDGGGLGSGAALIKGGLGRGGFPWGQFGSSVICLDLDRLLTGCEAIIRLVPKGCVVCCAEFGVDGDVLGGIDFYPACGWVPSEFTVIGGWVPKVIEVFPVVRCVIGVIVHGLWVEFGVGVGTPHVSGVGGLS